jgi:hypothetical protein
MIKNLMSTLFPEMIGELVQSGYESNLLSTIEYVSLGLYYLIFTLYIFKKKYLYVGIIWIAHICISAVFYYQLAHIDYIVLNEDEIAKLVFNIKMMGVTSVVTGSFFVITETRRRIWLRIFGYMTILSAVGMLKQDVLLNYNGIYVIVVTLIPAPLIINYWLDLRQFKTDKKLRETESDVLDVIDGDMVSARD